MAIMDSVKIYEETCQQCALQNLQNAQNVDFESHYIQIITAIFYELIMKQSSSLLSMLCSRNDVSVETANFSIENQRYENNKTVWDIIPILDGINTAFAENLDECSFLFSKYQKSIFQKKSFKKGYDYASAITFHLKFLDDQMAHFRIHDTKLTDKLKKYAEERRANDLVLSKRMQQLQVSLQDGLEQIKETCDDIENNITEEPINQFISLFTLVSETLQFHPNDKNKDAYHNLVESCEDFLENIKQALAMLGVTIIDDVNKQFEPQKHKTVRGTQPVRGATISRVVKIGFIYKDKVLEKAEVELNVRRNDSTKIGIDFGTTFSLPAGLINGSPSLLLPTGEYGIPSVFYYDKEVGVQIGKAADENAVFYPNNVKRDIKMEISTQDDSFVSDGKIFDKRQIIGYIFKEITQVAREEMKNRELESQTIDGAVISVPAACTPRELEIIKDAAQIPESDGGACLKVLGFIREPVAAAIAYFKAPNTEDEKTILIYDLGGGTCDIAIVRSDRDTNEWYKVIDSDMKRIGGRDWDKVLIDMIKERYCQVAGDIHFDAEVEDKIRRKAIETKHILSRQNAAHASINISGQVHTCTITVKEFESGTSEMLQSTLSLVKDLVERCETSIDYIGCVGGSSNMPQVRKAFENTYPAIPVRIFNPETAIAFGAAMYAEHLTEANCLSDYGEQ